jgi:hypothetical protein
MNEMMNKLVMKEVKKVLMRKVKKVLMKEVKKKKKKKLVNELMKVSINSHHPNFFDLGLNQYQKTYLYLFLSHLIRRSRIENLSRLTWWNYQEKRLKPLLNWKKNDL